jgi:hypothetical protein
VAYVNPMKTTLVTTLLLSTLAFAGTALADPIVSTDGIMPFCELDGLDGDGQPDRVGNAWVNVDVLDQDGQPCLH